MKPDPSESGKGRFSKMENLVFPQTSEKRALDGSAARLTVALSGIKDRL